MVEDRPLHRTPGAVTEIGDPGSRLQNSAASGAAGLSSAPDTPVVVIESGILAGKATGDVERFLGIPYAAAPVGALRWRPPQPVVAWQGARPATEFGNDCVQNRPSWERMTSDRPLSEDCLYINVWRPVGRADTLLPVMVWVHGGGFVMGTPSTPALEGSALARQGVVVVSFNYRLGRFGFFAHPALTAAQRSELLGNYGLMDQLAALRWVQRNIATFGGDPDNVTIFGESAGGTSVLQLMAIEQARGLFHRAIAQSSGGRDRWPNLNEATHRPSAEAIGERFAMEAGFHAATVEDLRSISPDRLRGQLDLVTMEWDTYSGPMIDGVLVKGAAARMFQAVM
jgi:para-nitrobenzyl esterase